jgi:1-deoxyxylulose-5-phosphate synthase
MFTTSQEDHHMTKISSIELGITGISISRFILGAGVMGGVATVTGPGIGLDDDGSFAVVEKAIELGINVVDTADIYTGGESERILGRWVANHDQAPILIQTKTGVTADGPNLAPNRLRRQLEKSRETLGRVDLFLAHAVDPNTDWSESLPVFSDAIDRGVILAYGLSNVSEQDLTSALETADRMNLRRPSVIQNRYSLIARQDDDGVLPLARGESLAYTPYSPLAAGLLAGRYSKDPAAQHGSRLSTQRPTLEAIEDPQTLQKIRRFDAVAEQHDVAPAALALGWLLNRSGVTAPIVGVSKPAHWDAIVASTELAWTDQLAEAVEEAFAPEPVGR